MRHAVDISKCKEGVYLTLSRPVRALKHIRDLRTLRLTFKGMSQETLGALLGEHRDGSELGLGYTRAYISQLESGKLPFTDAVIAAVKHFVVANMYEATNGDVGVRADLGTRRWRFTPLTHCKICARQFIMERSNQTKCKRHRSKR